MQAVGRQPRRAPDSAPVHYELHRPVQTTLYRLVQQHAASFIAHTEASTGSELLRFIKDEFDAFLECEILAYGSLRPRCGGCGHDKLLAFSCKRWGSALRAERVGCGRQPPIWSTTLLLALSRKAPPAGTFAVMRRATDPWGGRRAQTSL